MEGYVEEIIKTCNVKELRQILKETPDFVNIKTPITRETALHIALGLTDCRNRNKIIKELLKYYPDVNAEDFSGMTPIFIAARLGELDIFYQLLEMNTEQLKTETSDGTTLLMKAIEGGNGEIIDWILENLDIDINASNFNGETALSKAADFGNWPVFQYLITLGATSEFPLLAETVLGISYGGSMGGHREIIEYLLQNDEDINNGQTGATALFRAVQNGDLETVKFLVDKEADVNLGDEFGTTPLMRAVRDDNIEIVKYLISQNAYVNLQDEMGNTALMNAVEAGNLQIIKYLIEHSADLNKTNAFNETAMDIAVRENLSAIASYLRTVASSTTGSPIRMKDRYERDTGVTGKMGRRGNSHVLYEE